MIELRAHCKINLGLRVLRRRDDGFHDIETVMFPVRGLFDTVSVAALPDSAAFPGSSGGFVDPSSFLAATPLPYPAPEPVFPTGSALEVSGLGVDCPPEHNICMRALRLVQRECGIGEAVVRLHKVVPSGAGLGGGSADAAAVLDALNREFMLELSASELERLGAQLGSDVPFFLRSGMNGNAAPHIEPQLCTGRGEVMTPVEVNLAGLWLVVAKPLVAVSTAGAYAGVTPHGGGPSLADIVRQPIGEWREILRNDFEDSVFARHPEIDALKRSLYGAGAIYASMSGSGSAVFGIFDQRPKLKLSDSIFAHSERLV